MYFDLFVPFPQEQESATVGKGKNKGKGKAAQAPLSTESRVKSCWDGLEPEDREGFAEKVSLAGHQTFGGEIADNAVGYNVIGVTIAREPETHPRASPFATVPYPHLDPRFPPNGSASSEPSSLAGPSRTPMLVQVTRYHFRLDDSKSHPLTTGNTNALRNYDILSCQPTSDKAFQLACTDMSNPGPNQLSIITLPLHERQHHFRLVRKQLKQAQRNGVIIQFELLYSAGLFPSPSVPTEAARRYRQNWLTNAREIVRATGGKGIILSSGPGGSRASMRGPADLVNLAATLGIPANLAKDCLSSTAKTVLLRAQARKTFKGVVSAPRMLPPPGSMDAELVDEGVSMAVEVTGEKRAAAAPAEQATLSKKAKVSDRP